jgi:hypothetical protein
MRSILDHQPGYHVWTLVIAFAVLSAFQSFYYFPFLGHVPMDMLVLAELIFSIFFDVVMLFLYTGVWYLGGKWWGGKGTWRDVMTAYGWAYPPTFIGMIFLNISDLAYWSKINSGMTDFKSIYMPPQMPWQSPCNSIATALLGWTLVLQIINLSEAHKISIPRAFVLVMMINIPMALIYITLIVFMVLHLMHFGSF